MHFLQLIIECDFIKHVLEFIGALFPPYGHAFRVSAFNIEFMIHVQATIFYHTDIIGTKSTILAVVSEAGAGGGVRGQGWEFQNTTERPVTSEYAGSGAVQWGAVNGMSPLQENYISRLDARK